MSVRSLFATSAVLLLLLSGCRKPGVESYRVPKEKDPEMPLASNAADAGQNASPAPASPMPDAGIKTAEGASLTWTAPAAWKQKPATAMRKGSYTVPGNGGVEGDLSITAFPGDMARLGGELANINRWRGQVQLAPIGDGELARQVEPLEANGLRFGVVDFVGPGSPAPRLLAAYVPYDNATWFFKLSGPDEVVAKAKPAFMDFLKTIKPANGGTP